MKYIAVLDSENEFTEEVIDDLKNTGFLGDNPRYAFVIDNIQERKVEKCTDCEEYNQEKHYCPKFCDVIRETAKEMQEFYKGEHEKLERIEQIMNKESEGYIQNNSCLREIREVLGKE